jgi:AFG3 family protein
VAKLEVANNNMVRVYLRPGFGAPTSSSSGPDGYPAATSGSTPQSAMANAARQAAKQASSGGGSAPGAAAGDVVQLGGEELGGGQQVAGRREPPAYYFLIGSVDAFERQLEQAQRDLGIPSSAWVPVKYSYEVGVLGMLGVRESVDMKWVCWAAR